MTAKSTSRKNNTVPLTCACGKSIVPPSGPEKAPILIVGEFPGKEEMRSGQPFVGPAGMILRSELNKVGITLGECRVTNLSLHQFPDDPCWQLGLEQVIREAKGRRAILLLGSECSKMLLKKPVTTISGLRVKSEYLDAPIVMATINPAALITGTVGELRLTLQRFAKLVKKGKSK